MPAHRFVQYQVHTNHFRHCASVLNCTDGFRGTGHEAPMPTSIYRKRAKTCTDKAQQACRTQDRNRHLREAALWQGIADQFDAYEQGERIWEESVRLGNVAS